MLLTGVTSPPNVISFGSSSSSSSFVLVNFKTQLSMLIAEELLIAEGGVMSVIEQVIILMILRRSS